MKSLHGRYYDYKALIQIKPKIEELQVTGNWSKNKWGNIKIECQCSCGKITDKYFSDLNSIKRKILSCGCKQKEIVRKIGEANRKYTINEDKLVDCTIMSYIIGLLAADGYQMRDGKIVGIALIASDKDILDRIKHYVEYTGPVIVNKAAKASLSNNDVAKLNIQHKKWVEYCEENGIIKNKTKDYKTPDKYIYDTHYWRGLIDGDRCIFNYIEKGYPKYGISLCGTEHCMMAFKKYCEKIVDKQLDIAIVSKPGVKYFMITGENAWRVLEEIYADISNEFYLKRKYEIYKDIKI